MAYKNLIFEEEKEVAILKINRPKALNTLNKELLLELENVFMDLESNKDIRVVIITGTGEKAFVAGADIAEMKGMGPREAKVFASTGQRVFGLIEKSSKPVIAAINGFALGGGNELALACDLRIASEKARFGQPEVGLGITAGFGGTQRLAKIIGMGKTKEILFTGEMIDAREAYRIGLINKVVPAGKLISEARNLARKIAKNAPIAIMMTKEAINFGLDEGVEKGIAYESNAFALCFSTEDQKIGMNAFFNKEKVKFKGR